MAAVLTCGDEAVLSHAAAAALWDLRPSPSGRIDVTARGRSQRHLAGIRHHCVRKLDPRDCTTIDAIPVTTPERLMLDLAEILSAQRLRRMLEEVDRRDLLDGNALRATIDRNAGRHGIRPLRQAISSLTGSAPWTQSELEEAFLVLVRDAGLPEPRCNVLVHGELVDCFWPDAPLVVELDGFGFHRSRSRFEDDRRKDVKLGLRGIPVLRYTQRRLENERGQVVSELTRMLAAAAAADR
jgi:very-short-patch-repair endonuclease